MKKTTTRSTNTTNRPAKQSDDGIRVYDITNRRQPRKPVSDLKTGTRVHVTARLRGRGLVHAYGAVVAVSKRSMQMVVTPEDCPPPFDGTWLLKFTGGSNTNRFIFNAFKRVGDDHCIFAAEAGDQNHTFVVTALKELVNGLA